MSWKHLVGNIAQGQFTVSGTKPTLFNCQKTPANGQISARNYGAVLIRKKDKLKPIYTKKNGVEQVSMCLTCCRPYCVVHKPDREKEATGCCLTRRRNTKKERKKDGEKKAGGSTHT